MLPNFREELMQSRAIQQIVAEALTPALEANNERIARNMIAKNSYPVEEIAELTGLSLADVKKLMKEAGKA